MSEFDRLPDEIIFGKIVFICGRDHEKTKQMIRLTKQIRYKENCSVIVVAKENYYDDEEDRYLSDYTEYGKRLNIMLQEKIL